MTELSQSSVLVERLSSLNPGQPCSQQVILEEIRRVPTAQLARPSMSTMSSGGPVAQDIPTGYGAERHRAPISEQLALMLDCYKEASTARSKWVTWLIDISRADSPSPASTACRIGTTSATWLVISGSRSMNRYQIRRIRLWY